MDDDTTVVFVTPIVPAATGNGLAMRAGMLLDALAAVAAVHVVVVPVSGPAEQDLSWTVARARTVGIVGPLARDVPGERTTTLTDPDLEERLTRTAPLPARAALAPPTLAANVAAALPDAVGQPAAVLAMRLYLAPLGIHLARLVAARRVVIDADDDDGALLRSLGDDAEADAFDRLARCWLPDADAVLAASRTDAAGIAKRAGLDRVDVVPNAVDVPVAVPPPPGADRILFVGNLTYEPNRVAARMLAGEVLPRLRARRPGASLDLVGAHGGSLDDLARVEGVHLPGAVPDVAPHYAGADVVVVPLHHGGGTRIKILEAFAHRRPVVATPAAIAGIEAEHEHEVVVAESAEDIVRAVDELLADPTRASAMVERAHELALQRYSRNVVAPLVRVAVLGSDARDVPPRRPQRVDGLEVHEVDDGLVVYDPATDRVHSLNPSASVVFELCTGERTEPEIAALLQDAWGLPEPPRDDVASCLELLRSEGIVT